MEVRNRFKGQDLLDRVTDELWTEVRDIVQETGIKMVGGGLGMGNTCISMDDSCQCMTKTTTIL